MGDEIDELIDEVTVDAHGENEQLCAFRQAFEQEGRFPFTGRVVGADVQVESIDYAGVERRGLIAYCHRDRQLHAVSLLDVTPSPPVHRGVGKLVARHDFAAHLSRRPFEVWPMNDEALARHSG